MVPSRSEIGKPRLACSCHSAWLISGLLVAVQIPLPQKDASTGRLLRFCPETSSRSRLEVVPACLELSPESLDLLTPYHPSASLCTPLRPSSKRHVALFLDFSPCFGVLDDRGDLNHPNRGTTNIFVERSNTKKRGYSDRTG